MPTKIVPTDAQYIKAAQSLSEDGTLFEVDEDADVSHSEEENGAYVQAWVWVPEEWV